MKLKIIFACMGVSLLTACSTTSVQDSYKPKEERVKISGDMQEVKLTTSPPGASCVVERGDTKLGELPLTPGFVTIKRTNFKSVDVTCSKDGYNSQTEKLRTIIGDKAVGGNIGAVITMFKMADGSYSSYENSLFIKLTPSKFNASLTREQYIADQLVLLNVEYQKEARRFHNCRKKKCQRKLRALQQSFELRSARMKAEAENIPSESDLEGNMAESSTVKYGEAMTQRCGSYGCELTLRDKCDGADYRVLDQQTGGDRSSRKDHNTGQWIDSRTEYVDYVYQCVVSK